jgi:hypothetical protein
MLTKGDTNQGIFAGVDGRGIGRFWPGNPMIG